MKIEKFSNMNYAFFIISIIFASTFIGVAFAQQATIIKEFTQEEIDEMKNTAVLITMNHGTFTIELYPEDAPNTVYNFLNLVESGFYDGVIFHRIIPGFMIQAGDPNTKNPESDRDSWGSGRPGYTIVGEFNALQHDRGIISMARGGHPDSASSQFFIVHKDSPDLDGKYAAFGRLVPGTHSIHALENIAALETDERNAPLDVSQATILTARILSPFTTSGLGEPDRNASVLKTVRKDLGDAEVWHSDLYGIQFDLPYRWVLDDGDAQDRVSIVMEPAHDEHNAQLIIRQSGFIPQVLVGSEKRTSSEIASNTLSTGFFSIDDASEPTILSNHIFTTENGKQAHLMVTTQDYETDTETLQFKVIQIHFNNSENNYSVIYVNLSEWFRYEVMSFVQVVSNLEIELDGKMQELDFDQNVVYKQVISDVKEKPEPESLPPARIGSGCLIATASYGSELAPQVQLLREIRDNTVLQTQSGTSFMNGFSQFYYSFSPTISDYERESPIFKEAVKLTLTPLLASLTLLQYVDINSEHEMLGYGIGVILLNITMYFIAPAVLITKIRSFYKLQ